MQVTLRQALKRRRMSKAALAQKSGVHQSTVGRIVSGETKPLHETVTAFEAALELEPGTLVFHSGASR